jgi:cholesterol transport system auxiliary component
MLAPLLIQAVERAGSWGAVVQMPSTVRGDYRLDVEHLALQQEFFQQPSQVRLTLRAQLIELQKQCVLGLRKFEVLEDAPSENAYGGVLAANLAVTRLLKQMTDWLNTYLINDVPGTC